MKYTVSYINRSKIVILTIIAISLFPEILAQKNKPRQLREEILQQQSANTITATPHVAKTKKTRPPEPPGAGVTVLKPANPAANKNATLIYLEKSDNLLFDQNLLPNIQILKGNVCFRHDDALLYCDSAHFNDEANSFDAFGNVRIVQADTLTVYGDFLNYDGNTKLARIWDHVKMINRNTQLTTDILYYDRYANLAYYDTGGVIEDGTNTLTSVWGQYSPSTKIAIFKDQVNMTNPDATLTTDTLKYNTDNSVADIVGNSLVVYKEETDIYSRRGWYDTKNDRMMLLDRSLIEQKDGKTLTGDTIFYDKQKKYGEAFSNVELIDPNQKTTLAGNFVSYDEIKHTGLATDSALFIDWSTRDSLFLSADTLYSMKDSINTDTIAYNKLLAYKNVRFFRTDAQGMCDTLSYNTRDSIMNLRGLPVIWSDNNQMMGQRISAFTKNKKIDHVKIEQSAIAIQKDSLIYFNQMSGKEIIAHLDSGSLKRIYVNGNAESIFFPKDDKTHDYFGINKTISSYITIYFKEKKIERIVLTSASSGATYPLEEMEENDLYLRYFYWYEKERPQNVEDLFARFERIEPPKRKESTKKPAFPGSTDSEENTENSPARRSPGTNTGPSNTSNPINQGTRRTNQLNMAPR